MDKNRDQDKLRLGDPESGRTVEPDAPTVPPLGESQQAPHSSIKTFACLDKNPDQRYHTAAELGDDLGRLPADEPIRTRPIDVIEQLRRRGRMHADAVRTTSLSIALLLAVIAIVVIGRTAFRQTRMGILYCSPAAHH